MKTLHYPILIVGGGTAGITVASQLVRKQAPVLVANLLAAMNGRPPAATYDGYSSQGMLRGRA